MVKEFIKEMFILILFCIAILLVLGVIFYEYIPNNKVIQTAEIYITPQDLKEELQTTVQEADLKIIQTYEVSKDILSTHQSAGIYAEGKVNPFADYTLSNAETNNQTGNTNTGGNTNSTGNNSSNTNTAVPEVNTANQNKR